MKNIYVCGPTVYDSPHIGNIRPILTFDIYIRALKVLKEEVNFIHNITDIDDKIIDKAARENRSEEEVAQKYKEQYLTILEKLNIQKPNHMPEVMNNMELIIQFIQSMIDNGKAYESDGNVYFDVTSIAEYGEISNRKLENMFFENEGNKRHPGDFALWKRTTRGITFKSPWSHGRPGWHTECAAFVDMILDGKQLDIHGGGIDLIFPHHENESIQYRAVNHVAITNEWKHVGHINLNGEKMSKSLGNIFTAHKFIETHGNDILRMIFLNSSVTAPIDITENIINNAQNYLSKLRKVFFKAQLVSKENNTHDMHVVRSVATEIKEWNFANAMKIISEEIKTFNTSQTNSSTIVGVVKLLGFNFSKVELSPGDITLYKRWEQLRDEQDWVEADKLREILQDKKLI